MPEGITPAEAKDCHMSETEVRAEAAKLLYLTDMTNLERTNQQANPASGAEKELNTEVNKLRGNPTGGSEKEFYAEVNKLRENNQLKAVLQEAKKENPEATQRLITTANIDENSLVFCPSDPVSEQLTPERFKQPTIAEGASEQAKAAVNRLHEKMTGLSSWNALDKEEGLAAMAIVDGAVQSSVPRLLEVYQQLQNMNTEQITSTIAAVTELFKPYGTEASYSEFRKTLAVSRDANYVEITPSDLSQFGRSSQDLIRQQAETELLGERIVAAVNQGQ